MENKCIEETGFGPEIKMDISGIIRIHGKSMMEDASLFFQPCHSWIEEYIQLRKGELVLEIDLSYFNSSSAKQLMKMLMVIDDSEIQGRVVWIYPEKNDVLLERGQELEIMLDLPFEFRAK